MEESIKWLQSRSNEELLALRDLFSQEYNTHSGVNNQKRKVDTEVRRRAVNMASFMFDLDNVE
jgi:hypothetical protein